MTAVVPLEPSKGPNVQNMLPVCNRDSFFSGQNGAAYVQHLATDDDEGGGLPDPETREKIKQRKLSESQMKGRGLHQRCVPLSRLKEGAEEVNASYVVQGSVEVGYELSLRGCFFIRLLC